MWFLHNNNYKKVKMPYSFPNNIPTFAKNKSERIQKIVIEVFNKTFQDTKSETKARAAALAAMTNAEDKDNIEKASYTPTQSMRNAAKRGLALREKYNRGGLSAGEAKSEGVGSGVARARDIINGNLSLDTVKRMKSFFARHEKNFNPDKKEPDGGPTAGTIAWYLWGGSSGKSWANAILAREEANKSKTVATLKSADNMLKQALYVVLVPDEVDAHGDIYNKDEVRKACESFNSSSTVKANLFHMIDAPVFETIESYIAPCDMTINKEVIKEGTWLARLQFTNDEIFKGVLEGKYSGVSIGAMAQVEELE